ncbi:hypothetical protein Anas_03567 [Armadillidium nasatum]|uniref:Uncharacterized protein n=1 Tax=Armadillidium nasatum TaxID=96803 RepID=A0A5N5TNA6_9CRUS|nr:hypothetical protein Anas_03567 [Armadillidium nasatum]
MFSKAKIFCQRMKMFLKTTNVSH